MGKLDDRYIYAIGGVAIGIVIDGTFHDGGGAVILFIVGIFGRWLIGKIATPIFDQEYTVAKQTGSRLIKDPVKRSIWHHTLANHAGRWSACPDPICHP